MTLTHPNDDRLARIQALQFSDRGAAESLLLAFVRETFPTLDAAAVELRPLAVSLNSFNGFLSLNDGRHLFFKTHIEPGSIVSEYYNSTLLAEAGYPIIKPLIASTEYGKQFLIYDRIESPSVFDVARAIELTSPPSAGLTSPPSPISVRTEMGSQSNTEFERLRDAQQAADDELLRLYRKTLAWQTADEAANAPVHQLFAHRLDKRYADFYVGKPFALPGGKSLAWDDLIGRRWIINDVAYAGTLHAAIDLARELLRPDQAGWSVIGHGDAHNGNVFDMPTGLVYFDPAFGGRHHPLLDLAKPLFHNAFATWMYHPAEVAESLRLNWHDDGSTITMRHNYEPSAVRRMFFESKRDRVLRPLMAEIAVENWGAYLRAALLCCPLLTMNLADRVRFPPEIGLLGLTWAVVSGMERARVSGAIVL